MPELFVQQSRDISPDEFQMFLKELKDGKELNSLHICKRLKEEWIDFIENPKVNPENVELPDSRCLPRGNPKGKVAGLYGIFTHECFYVGVSTCNIRGRIRTHLGGDVEKNYRDSFEKLGDAEKISICYAFTPQIEGKKDKAKLELLELYLTALLRPRFLVDAALARSAKTRSS